MDRAERAGFGIAIAGHVLLFAILSLGLVSTAKLPPPVSEPIDVQFVDAVGMRSAAPRKAAEPPAPSEAPEVGKPEEAAAPEPTPAPPEPKPAPTPPRPAPAPKPEPRATPPKPAPEPKPAPKPQPKPAEKAAPARPVEASEPRRRPDHPAETARPAPAAPAKPKGSLLGPNFLKGIVSEKSSGKAQTPRASTVSAQAMAGLAAAIKRQVQPCYELGSLQGTPAMQIVTVLRLRFNRDGTVSGTPSVEEQSGVTGDNAGYRQQIADVARRAVLRCAPLRLPPELYEGGWEDIQFVFTPGQMG